MQEPMGNGLLEYDNSNCLQRNVNDCMEKHVLVVYSARVRK